MSQQPIDSASQINNFTQNMVSGIQANRQQQQIKQQQQKQQQIQQILSSGLNDGLNKHDLSMSLAKGGFGIEANELLNESFQDDMKVVSTISNIGKLDTGTQLKVLSGLSKGKNQYGNIFAEIARNGGIKNTDDNSTVTYKRGQATDEMKALGHEFEWYAFNGLNKIPMGVSADTDPESRAMSRDFNRLSKKADLDQTTQTQVLDDGTELIAVPASVNKIPTEATVKETATQEVKVVFDKMKNARNAKEKVQLLSSLIGEASDIVKALPSGFKGGGLAVIAPLLDKAGLESEAANKLGRYAAIKAQIGNVAREIAGEKGVLTDKDIERALKLLPDIGEGRSTQLGKLQQVQNQLNDRIMFNVSKNTINDFEFVNFTGNLPSKYSDFQKRWSKITSKKDNNTSDKLSAVGRTSSGKIKLSDGRLVSADEAKRLLGK